MPASRKRSIGPTRREFLRHAALATPMAPIAATAMHAQTKSTARRGRPRSSEFVFARLRYDSGDWDYNPKVAANVLDTIVQYTTIPVYPRRGRHHRRLRRSCSRSRFSS